MNGILAITLAILAAAGPSDQPVGPHTTDESRSISLNSVRVTVDIAPLPDDCAACEEPLAATGQDIAGFLPLAVGAFGSIAVGAGLALRRARRSGPVAGRS